MTGGLYNVVFGVQEAAGLLLSVLGFTTAEQVGRFRDAWVERTAEGVLRIAVYTRNGGGNRDHYDDDYLAGPACTCTGCVITYRLPAWPGYLSDGDDEFDSTYATVYFEAPAALVELLKDEEVRGPVDTSARWLAAIAALEAEGRDG